MNELVGLTATQIAGRIASREVSSRELVGALLRRIEETEPLVHAYTTAMADSALAEAGRVDGELARGVRRGRLAGVPVALKDIVETAGTATEAGSRVLAGWKPERDAAVVERLRAAGAVVVGKTHTHEFAYGVNVPPTRNPWRLDCYPGGSSAGSGAAVAARSAFAAIGTDGGGSIRCPASVNGVVGLKPTNGRVSRRGVVPMSATFDTVGPLTRTVADCALLLGAIAGHDPRDPISLDAPVPDYGAALARGVRGVRLGVERPFFFSDRLTADVRRAAEDALAFFERAGAEVVEVRIPELEQAVPVAMPPILADTTAYHHWWIRHRADRYEPATRVMIELGELVPATHYVTAQRARRLLRERVRGAFEAFRLDALFAPTLPMPAVPVEQVALDLTDGTGGSPGSSYFRQCVVANAVGIPALSFPGGFSEAGLPIGLALFGRPLGEAWLLRIAHAYEAAHPWHRRVPALTPAVAAGGGAGTH